MAVFAVSIFSANDWFHIAELNFYDGAGKLIPKTNYSFRQAPKDFYTERGIRYVFDNINDGNTDTFFHSATQKPIIIEVLFNNMDQTISAVEIWNRKDSPDITRKRIVGTTVSISSRNWNAVYRIDQPAPGYIFIPPYVVSNSSQIITTFIPKSKYESLLGIKEEGKKFIMYHPVSINLLNTNQIQTGFTGIESSMIPPNILYLFILLIVLAVVYYFYSNKNKSIYAESKDDSLT